MELFISKEPFKLENGTVLPEVKIAYHTYGTLNEARNNVVWICHALTANSDPMEWWPSLLEEHHAIDTSQYFIVCANILGSCYGTTGPMDIDPATSKPYYSNFPFITIRDVVKGHQLLVRKLVISGIDLLIGASMGGYQALEWVVVEKNFIRRLFLLATSAIESAWGIAIHASQRLAIETDITFGQPIEEAGKKGLIAARAIGMITYRNFITYQKMQGETDLDKSDHFKAASYIEYQGKKLADRFNAYSYWILTKAMDSHNLSRNRNVSLDSLLREIEQPTLIIGITTDILCPVSQQQFLAENIPNSKLVEIDSDYGHDGFLVEGKRIAPILKNWMRDSALS